MTVQIDLIDEHNIDLLLSADAGVFDAPIRPDLARAYVAHPDYLIALAHEEGKVVGMASGLFYFHPDKPREFYVNEVGVAESHQRRGIASRLMEKLLAAARQGGAHYAWVGTESGNFAARALYRRLGGEEDLMAYYGFELKNPAP